MWNMFCFCFCESLWKGECSDSCKDVDIWFGNEPVWGKKRNVLGIWGSFSADCASFQSQSLVLKHLPPPCHHHHPHHHNDHHHHHHPRPHVLCRWKVGTLCCEWIDQVFKSTAKVSTPCSAVYIWISANQCLIQADQLLKLKQVKTISKVEAKS